MIKALILDFDGVILESSHIKTDAFKALFSNYPDKVAEIVSYHERNMGISRYTKFRYIFKEILHEDLLPEKESVLGNKFSQFVLDKVLAAPFVRGVNEFLSTNNKSYKFYIASGTPEKELSFITEQRNISHYFEGIYGAPSNKADIIRDIVRKGHYLKNQVVFVGDGASDRDAARTAGIHFIARISPEGNDLNAEKWKIQDFRDLIGVLNEINREIK
jgi:phosphoglycolate phosphatase-like HAD superfamily hydrolase